MHLPQFSPVNNFDAHRLDLLTYCRIRKDPAVVIVKKVACGDRLQFAVGVTAVNDHLSDSWLQIPDRVQVPLLTSVVVFSVIKLVQVILETVEPGGCRTGR